MTSKNGKKELMMITLTKGVELYLSNLEVEGKSPRYIKWLRDRLNTSTYISARLLAVPMYREERLHLQVIPK